MRRILLIIVLCGAWLTSTAVKLEDRYVMRPVEGGQLYFIVPYRVPAVLVKGTPVPKPMEIDVTYLTMADTMTVNISVWDKTELHADSIALIGASPYIMRTFQTFFIEREKQYMLHRYSLRCTWEEWNTLYESENPFTVVMYAPEKEIRYAFPSKRWKKEQAWMKEILHLIATNKQLYK